MKWVVARSDRMCGGCQQLQPRGEPIGLFTLADHVRCLRCAEKLGFPFDDAAAAAVKADRDSLAAVHPVPPPIEPLPEDARPPQLPSPARPLHKSWSGSRPDREVRDPKAAQIPDP